MKNIIKAFAIYPFGKDGGTASTENLVEAAAGMAKELGQPRTPSNFSAGISCDPHENLELVITPMGGPGDMLAVQVCRDGRIVLVGLGQTDRSFGSHGYKNTVHVIARSSDRLRREWPEWVNYTFRWSEE